MDSSQATPVALRRFAKLTAASTLFLIFAGAMVTSTGSGLAVPDWPLAFGMVFPPMVGGIFYEHGHRMVATTVGFFTLVQAFWLHFREPKAFVRKLGWVALLAVLAQGALGGLTVIFLLPPAISIGHASLAEIFFLLNVSIAFFTSNLYLRLRQQAEGSSEGIAAIGRLLLAAVYLQIFLGAVMRHFKAGLAIPDFPLSFGRLVPEFTSSGVVAAFAHRAWGVAVGVAIIALVPRVFRVAAPVLRRTYGLLVLLVVVQVALGAFTIWMEKQAIVTSFHVMTGAAVLATTLVFALAAGTLEGAVDAPSPIEAGGREVLA
jgi:cytochrome c oxidase assembly protein subunit 15